MHNGMKFAKMRAFSIEQPGKESVWTQPGEMHVKVQDLRPSINIIIFIKSRNMTWDGHVEHMGEDVYRILAWNPEGKKLLVELGVESRITLKWSLKRKGI